MSIFVLSELNFNSLLYNDFVLKNTLKYCYLLFSVSFQVGSEQPNLTLVADKSEVRSAIVQFVRMLHSSGVSACVYKKKCFCTLLSRMQVINTFHPGIKLVSLRTQMHFKGNTCESCNYGSMFQ